MAFGLVDALSGFPFGSGDQIVSVAVRLVNQFFTVFLGAGDIFKGCGDGFRRIDILKLNRGHLHAGQVLIEQTRRAQRVADKADHQSYLGFLAALVQSVPAFDVELSPDFTGLDELAEFVTATVGGGSS